MASAATVSNMASVLKTIWPQSEINDLMFDEAPLLAMMPKDTSWSGQYQDIIVPYGATNGRSANFARAKANKQNSKKTKMHIETSDNFSIWSVDHKLITLSRNDKGAIVKALQEETKQAMRKFKRSLCYMIYGNGGGSIGRVSTSTTLSSTTLTFRSARTLRYIEKGDVLKLASDDGNPTASQAGVRAGSIEVTAINFDSTAATVTPAISTGIPTAATSDYVFIDGDYGAALYGVDAYVPTTAPTTSIWTMDRTLDNWRLGGIRVGGKNMLIQEAVKKALKEAKNRGAKITHIFMSTDDYYNLEMALEGTRRREASTKVGNVGFTGLEFVGGGSNPVEVYPDADCPANQIYGLNLANWKLHSAGEYPDFLNINGNRFEQEETSNSFEGRAGGYAQVYTEMPGENFVLDLTA
jgi:hypothetical protein